MTVEELLRSARSEALALDDHLDRVIESDTESSTDRLVRGAYVGSIAARVSVALSKLEASAANTPTYPANDAAELLPEDPLPPCPCEECAGLRKVHPSQLVEGKLRPLPDPPAEYDMHKDWQNPTPTVTLRIALGEFALDAAGQVLEREVGEKTWDNATVCDHRGSAGEAGVEYLFKSLIAAEELAHAIGYQPRRVGQEDR